MNIQEFENIRPYFDNEINSAMIRISENPIFELMIPYIYPNEKIQDVKKLIKQIHNINDFQIKVMNHAIEQILKKTTTNFTFSGFEKLDKNKSYVFIANHRDILLDSALFQYALNNLGFKTSEITFGSNLMNNDFIVDIGKSNKMFKVERGGAPRNFLQNSIILSKYIRYTITQKKESIWIAQKNGRTKDGNDNTDQGIIKMFSLSNNDKNLVDNLFELNIVPIVISYQWETCDILKVNELSKSKYAKYIKSQNEDIQSVIKGATQFKGNIHLEVCNPIEKDELVQFEKLEKKLFFNAVTKLIDKRIHENYKLWDNNYIAFDIENNSSEFLNIKYSENAKIKFLNYFENEILNTDSKYDELKELFLKIYSNPIKNCLYKTTIK